MYCDNRIYFCKMLTSEALSNHFVKEDTAMSSWEYVLQESTIQVN